MSPDTVCIFSNSEKPALAALEPQVHRVWVLVNVLFWLGLGSVALFKF